jgi:pimeloyl-ACP methyl ester carboxylesterase
MPVVERAGARIYWHALGEGEPVVLVMGLGCSSAMWFRVAPRLARSHRVILLDNRGSGRTRVPTFVVHRVPAMAADIAAVLDAAGETSAHIVGFSMGGMISQQFAIDFAPRVRSLTLIGTHSGGPWAVQASAAVRRLLFAKAYMSAEESIVSMRPHTYARETSDALFEEDMLVRIANPVTARDYQAQLLALVYWSAYEQLPSMTMPTLVMHGLQDELIPPENGRVLAERLPRCTYLEMPDASHWLMTDRNETFLEALGQHLLTHAGTAAPATRSPLKARSA